MIGLGLRSNLLDVAHRPGHGSRIVALCDLDETLLQRQARNLDTEVVTTSDYAELLKRDDVDAVIVATPDYTHERLVIDALDAGKPVFGEKPLAISTESCDRILDAAMRTGTRLYVGHNMRHYRVVKKMKQLIDDGVIGEVKAIWCRHFVGHGGDFYFKDWHAQRVHVNSLLLQKGAHDLDVIHWLAGASSRVVQGVGRLAVYGDVSDRHDGVRHDNWFDQERFWPPTAQRGLHPQIDIEDISMMQMVLDNDVVASYVECHFTPDYWRNYTVIGTAGRIENFGDTDGVIRLWNRRGGYSAKGDREYRFRSETGGHGGADSRLMQEFVRFARDGGPTDTSPVSARDAVAAGCAGAESLRNGGVPITVASPSPAHVRYFADHQVKSTNRDRPSIVDSTAPR
jgi:predicted dehydrogenase